MLLTGRMILRAEWPGQAEPYYYWQHCFWVESTDFPNNAQMNLAILADLRLLYTSQVSCMSCRWYDPSDMSVVFQANYGAGAPGHQTAQENYNLLVAARWQMWGFDGSYSYHLHRQPVGEDYLEGSTWSHLGYMQQQTRMNTFLGQDIYRTKTGSLLNVGHVVVVPVKWQLRHGTKRRNRRFWLP